MRHLSIRTRLWAAMGVLIALMVVIAADSILSINRMSQEIRSMEQGAYPLAMAVTDLALRTERSVAAINAAALASRKDLLRKVDALDPPLEEALAEVRAYAGAASPIASKVEGIARKYQEVRAVGLDWVRATF